jgi:hypothetical protein
MFHLIRHILILSSLLLVNQVVSAQVVVAFQGGEGTAADNWGFSPIPNAGGLLTPGIVASHPNTGSYAIRAGGGNTTGCSGGSNCLVGGGATGCPMHGKDITFNTINVACLDNVQLSFYHRSHTYCSGNGFDTDEWIIFEVSINGGAWTEVGRVGGFGDYSWNYNTNPAGHPSSGYTAPNPFIYNVPAGTTTFAFRTKGKLNRSDEIYYLDDVKLTTTSTAYSFPGTAGLWNGAINTDWNNVCNWETRTLPVATTSVMIPSSAMNICEILAGNTGNCRNLVIDRSKLVVETPTSVLNVNGNLTIELNGELDISETFTTGGTINLFGNWLNKRDESAFTESGGVVNLVGSTTQNISVLAGSYESFYKLNINKPSGNVVSNTDLYIDPLNNGGASVMLTINSGLLDLNSNTITIFNNNSSSVARSGGGIISERTDNANKINWVIGSSTGNYDFPFVKSTGVYIPFSINVTGGSVGTISASTYPTPPDNLPWPNSPVAVTNLASASGLSPDNRDATVDRFWQIDATGSGTVTMNFRYDAFELPVAPFNNPNTIQAQRYEPSGNAWQPYLPGQSSSAFEVTLPGTSQFGTWALSNVISPLPIELLTFEAQWKNGVVNLYWITATEKNNDYFTVEKSERGDNFIPFKNIPGAGNSTQALTYQTIDSEPFREITYYRLKQTDYDGSFTYSPIRAVKSEQKKSASGIYPNPATRDVYIILSADDAGLPVILSDPSGSVRMVSKAESADRPLYWNIESLPAGLYFIKTGSGVVHKLVVQ